MRILPTPPLPTATVLFFLAGLGIEVQPGHPPQEQSKERAKQPVAFSHRLHVGLGMKCRFCHPSARVESAAGLPDSAICMTCHSKLTAEGPDLDRLVEFHRSRQPIPWVRYYVLSPDTFFSHRYHLAAGGQCRECHGEVEKKETLAAHRPLSMAECVGCHLSEGVPTDCGFCHTAALASRPVPTGREP